MNMLRRGTAMLSDPTSEWASVEKEPPEAVHVLTYYVAVLALIPAAAGFIGACLLGVSVTGSRTLRAPLFDGFLGAVFGYVATFATVLLVALWIQVLAPRFEGRRNFAGALKLAAYSFTPAWLAGIFLVLPGLHFLLLIGLYGAYILARGLPLLMKAPDHKSPLYAAAIVAPASLLILLTVVVQHGVFGMFEP